MREFDENGIVILDRVLFHSHLHPGERLSYVVHQHWWTVGRPLAKVGFFGWLLPIIFIFMFPAGLWLFGVWLLFGFFSFIYTVINWYFDAVLVTNLGLIDLDWRGFFDKTTKRIDFESIESAECIQTGFWATVLNFGDLVISTEVHHLGLPYTADPQGAEHAILHAKEHAEKEHSLESEEVLREVLSEIVANHIRSKKEGGLADLL